MLIVLKIAPEIKGFTVAIIRMWLLTERAWARAAARAGTVWTIIQPGSASAQNSGVGGDGKTRLLWRATDYHISLWRLGPSLDFELFHEYGPYVGFEPIAITTAPNNTTYVLWRHTDGH